MQDEKNAQHTTNTLLLPAKVLENAVDVGIGVSPARDVVAPGVSAAVEEMVQAREAPAAAGSRQLPEETVTTVERRVVAPSAKSVSTPASSKRAVNDDLRHKRKRASRKQSRDDRGRWKRDRDRDEESDASESEDSDVEEEGSPARQRKKPRQRPGKEKVKKAEKTRPKRKSLPAVDESGHAGTESREQVAAFALEKLGPHVLPLAAMAAGLAAAFFL